MYGAALLTVFLVTMWFLDGVAVYLSFITFVLFAIFYVPLRIKWDFNKYLGLFEDIVKVKNGEVKKKEFLDKVISIICDETGAPEIVISMLSNGSYNRTIRGMG